MITTTPMTMTMSLSKQDLRKKFREICNNIQAAYRESAALSAAKQLTELEIFKEANHISCYLSINHEFDTSPIIEAIWQAKKHCYLPYMPNSLGQKHLSFVHYQYGDALHENKHGILEPLQVKRTISPEDLDLVILPLIAFDCFGHRLGTGGGYYDKTFAFLANKTQEKPYLMGLAFAAQQIDLLPHEDWDITLKGVLTEQEFIRCFD